MRFDRLSLIRYGHFTDHEIVFDRPADGGDFHLVYGPNEAGKSTLRDACLDFLFGFQHKTRYAFLHQTTHLEVAAALSAAGMDGVTARRVKRRKDDLLDAAGAPAPNVLGGAVRAALGGIDRAAYTSMFSLDEASLAKGGEDILDSRGDLGALLFSATSGLASVAKELDDLRAEADGFYKPRAQKHRLKELTDELAEIDAEIVNSDVTASAFAALRQAEDTARAAYEDAARSAETAARRLAHVGATLDALPGWQALARLRARRTDLADAPDTADLVDTAEALRPREVGARTGLANARARVAEARAARDRVQVDRDALALAPALDRLDATDREVRYRAADGLAEARAERRRLDDHIADLLARLGRPDAAPASLRLDDATLATLRARLAERTRHLDRIETAEAERARADEAAAAARAALDAVPAPADLSALDRTLDAGREALAPAAVAAAHAQAAEAADDRRRELAALAPWTGDAAALDALVLPDAATLDALAARERQLADDRRDARKALDAAEAECAQAAADRDALMADATVSAAAALDDRRGARDAAWAEHRALVDAEAPPAPERLRATADRFEAAAADHDQAVEARLAHADAWAQVTEARRRLNRAEAERDTARRRDAALAADAAALEAELADRARALGLGEPVSAASLGRWATAARAVRDRWPALERKVMAARTRLDAATQARERLTQDLAAAGLEVGPGFGGGAPADGGIAPAQAPENAPDEAEARALLAHVDAALDRWRRAAQDRRTHERALADATAERDRRVATLDDARRALDAWTDAWRQALGPTWIAAGTEPETVAVLLDRLDDLAQRLGEARALDATIDALAADRDRFAQAVADLVAEAPADWALDPVGDPVAALKAVRDRVGEARAAERDHQTLTQEWQAAGQALAKAEAAMRDVDREIAALAERVPGCDDLGQMIAEIRRAAERDDLDARIAEAEDDLCRRLGAADLDAVAGRLAAVADDPEQQDELAAERERLDAQRDADRVRVSEAYAAWKQAEAARDGIGSDDRPARLAERRAALLLLIEEEAQAFLRLSAGVAMVEEALRAYRDTHRSSMMRRASEAFATITGGAFRGLDSAVSKTGEALVGVRAEGGTVTADEMSRGTRAQLYLALRIAGHAEFAERGPVPPFFADDILETFDDDRAAETFALLHAMAGQGQVIYLTHHRHLCEIARTVCGDGVRLHQLPGRGGT
ncbi:uncharacterized protein YhaN [Rhodothalassium salexigens DSM 2132]|uniref:Uncharacterized protein YhaN n=1 Tax=Rhodothalassium salexigens DSM 2132 TaxID=1188247 RepID=A0A4R2PUA8_RHOSA|nr:YhaN family protein [Rhodothalassium salexigens]MBB4210693.1 uncharacterized protein YhaN [Rhodothalassium salexigens DSM 2132]MBK1637894.1 hypothetical protein [Rhodothalassium salexigens DSM 2132]TCP37751.1 uncharacterized protein YhaN [Rhodothalassium salexigens DSM 2132]